MSSKINHTNEEKGNEKKRERAGRKEEKRLKIEQRLHFLVFFILVSVYRDIFDRKSPSDAQEDYLAKRFKNPATSIEL